jgi:hypothetical protein
MSPDTEYRLRTRTVRARFRQARFGCVTGCACVCHNVQHSAPSSLIGNMLGQLFVGYAGIPVLSYRCNSPTCLRVQSPTMSVEYWFPLGIFWSQIVQLQIAYHSQIGPSFQLSTLRQVPDSAQSVAFALNGNIDGLKGLLAQNLASPRDVSSTRGYSLLRVSTQTGTLSFQPLTNLLVGIVWPAV